MGRPRRLAGGMFNPSPALPIPSPHSSMTNPAPTTGEFLGQASGAILAALEAEQASNPAAALLLADQALGCLHGATVRLRQHEADLFAAAQLLTVGQSAQSAPAAPAADAEPADAEIQGQLPQLRKRARDMLQNTPDDVQLNRLYRDNASGAAAAPADPKPEPQPEPEQDSAGEPDPSHSNAPLTEEDQATAKALIGALAANQRKPLVDAFRAAFGVPREAKSIQPFITEVRHLALIRRFVDEAEGVACP